MSSVINKAGRNLPRAPPKRRPPFSSVTAENSPTKETSSMHILSSNLNGPESSAPKPTTTIPQVDSTINSLIYHAKPSSSAIFDKIPTMEDNVEDLTLLATLNTLANSPTVIDDEAEIQREDGDEVVVVAEEEEGEEEREEEEGEEEAQEEEYEEEVNNGNWIVVTPADLSKSSQTRNEMPKPSSRIENRNKRKRKSQTKSNYRSETPQKPRIRATTPDGAELVTIIPSVVIMHDLASPNLKTGHKSEREKRMQKIDWGAVKRSRKDEEQRIAMKGKKVAPQIIAADEEDSDKDLDEEEKLQKLFAKAAENKKSKVSIQIRLVNGQQVIDEQSQRVDFHALAYENVDQMEEVVEHDDLTQNFNSQTFVNMKRREPSERIANRGKWTVEATEKFYDCLSRYGTDFMIISKMFPGRTRGDIRNKYGKEERLNPLRLQEALRGVGSKNWDLEFFKRESGLVDKDFKDPRKIEQDLRRAAEARQPHIEEARRQTAEDRRQRKIIGAETSSDEENNDEDEDEDEIDGRNWTRPDVSNRGPVIEMPDDDDEDSEH